MKLYEYIKEENERTAKIFGIPVMKQTSDYMTAERYQEFLGGLVTTIKLSSKESDSSNKEIKILGKSVIKRFEENNFRTYSFLGFEYRKISLIEEFKKQYFKYFDKEHDDIYILRANSGEIYLTLTYLIDSIIKKNGSKKPLLVATQKYHIDMIKMICPDLPYVYIKKLNLKIIGDSFKIDNFRFFLLFDAIHFRKVELDIKGNELGKHHYFKSILERLDFSNENLKMRKMTVLPDAEQSMLEKVEKTGLNLDKFVFLAPEAQSCKLYDEDFWVVLVNKLQEMGYDVFVNLVEKDIKLKNAIDFKTCDLRFAEVFALAKKAKRIISLRSGFTEFLLQTNVPIDVLYTKFRHRHIFNDMSSYHVLHGFGLIQLPFVNVSKIREFNMFEISPAECLKQILENLDLSKSIGDLA